MRETFEDIVGDVMTMVPAASSDLARIWVNNSFRRIAERRQWSWLYGYTQIYIPAAYTTGTIEVTQFSDEVVGTGTTFLPSHVGRQLKIGGQYTIHTIREYVSADTVRIDPPYMDASASGLSFKIMQVYVTPPDDFHTWDSVISIDPARHRIHLDIDRAELDIRDPRRDRYGSNASILAFSDYSTSVSGEVDDVVHVSGTAAVEPTSSGSYTGVQRAVFTVEITSTGASGTAQFQWKKDGGAYTTGATTSTVATELQEGVYVAFPTGTYTDGAVFIIPVDADTSPGLPRYELYPHQTTEQVLPARYIRRYDDLEDSGIVIPRYIRGDVILEGALCEAATWPGPADNPNPYAQISRRNYHGDRFKEMLERLVVQDNEVHQQNIFDHETYAPLPWGTISAMWPDRNDIDWF